MWSRGDVDFIGAKVRFFADKATFLKRFLLDSKWLESKGKTAS